MGQAPQQRQPGLTSAGNLQIGASARLGPGRSV